MIAYYHLMRGDPVLPGGGRPVVSWPELMAAMSLETGLAVCLVSMGLARAAGLDEDGLSRT